MTSRIVVALRVKANPARTFDVFTREIASWWQASTLFQFTPRSPGRLAFEPPGQGRDGRFTETLANGKVFEIGPVRVWEPGARLVFGWRQAAFAQGQATEVDVRFEAVGDEHRGWDTVPGTHAAKHGFPELVFLRRHGAWWRDLLEALARRVQTETG